MILSIKGTVTVDSREDNKHGLICISLLFKRMLEVQPHLSVVPHLHVNRALQAEITQTQSRGQAKKAA